MIPSPPNSCLPPPRADRRFWTIRPQFHLTLDQPRSWLGFVGLADLGRKFHDAPRGDPTDVQRPVLQHGLNNPSGRGIDRAQVNGIHHRAACLYLAPLSAEVAHQDFANIPAIFFATRAHQVAPALWRNFCNPFQSLEGLVHKHQACWAVIQFLFRHGAHVLDHLSSFLDRHILSRYVTIQDRLIQRVAAFDGNVVCPFRERRVPDQRENEVIHVFPSMGCIQSYDFVPVKCGEDGRNCRFRSRI